MRVTDFYKKAVKAASDASHTIEMAALDHERDSRRAKSDYEEGVLGEKGYGDKLKELESVRHGKTAESLSRILVVGDEFATEMDELAKLDGDMVDGGALKILDSGISLTSWDWQTLADKYSGNTTMTRILMQKYDEHRPEEKEPIAVRFGQLPESRKKIFDAFIKTLRNACEAGWRPSIAGGGRLKTTGDYFNLIARESISQMDPFEGETFDNLDETFPVMTEDGAKVGTEKQNSTEEMNFDFRFTPIR